MNKDMNRNNRDRFMYSIFLIILLIGISIMYASLANNYGIKVRNSKPLQPNTGLNNQPVEPKKEEPVIYRPSRKPVIPTKKEEPKPKPSPDPEPDIPVIDPTDIDWKIEFDNIRSESASITPIVPATIADSKTEVDYSVKLKQPGDYYRFNIDIKNLGNTDAKIYSIVENGISNVQKKFLTHKVTYLNGNNISVNDTLDAGETKTITVLLKFRDDLSASDLPNQQQILNISYKVTYIEK